MTDKYTKRQLQIIHSAVDLIASRGMSALTMNRIATEINVTEPALYRHFKSKKDILHGVINLLSQSGIVPNETENTGWDLIEHTMQGKIEKFEDYPSLAAIIFSEEIFSGDNDLSTKINNMMEVTQDRFIRVIQMTQKKGNIREDIEAEQIALFMIGSFRFLVTQWRLSGNKFDLSKRAISLFQDARELFLVK